MSEPRRVLPQRRASETFTVIHWNQPFTVTAGFFDDGTVGEVFVDACKTGGDVEAIARDAAVVISPHFSTAHPSRPSSAQSRETTPDRRRRSWEPWSIA